MKMIFEIATRWNGKPINHAPVKLKLQNDSRDSVSLELDAPFFDDPKPAGVAGQPFPQLWDYEGDYQLFHALSILFELIACFIF